MFRCIMLSPLFNMSSEMSEIESELVLVLADGPGFGCISPASNSNNLSLVSCLAVSQFAQIIVR